MPTPATKLSRFHYKTESSLISIQVPGKSVRALIPRRRKEVSLMYIRDIEENMTKMKRREKGMNIT